MLKKIFDFLRDLFGGGAPEAHPAPAQASPAPADLPTEAEQQPSPVHEVEAKAEATPSMPGVDLPLVLQRAESQPSGTPGTLSLNGRKIADTLEGSNASNQPDQALLEPATYPIHLSATGGKHATYLYRFGEQHKGILILGKVGDSFSPSLHMGYRAEHLYGSVLVGKQAIQGEDKSLRLTDSESTYLKVYQLVAEALEQGKSVALTVQGEV